MSSGDDPARSSGRLEFQTWHVQVFPRNDPGGNSTCSDLLVSPYRKAVLTSANMIDLVAPSSHLVIAREITVRIAIRPGVPANNSPRLSPVLNSRATRRALAIGCSSAASSLGRCRGSHISRPSHCGDFGFVSWENINFSVEASCTTSCRQACLSFSERRCGVTECVQLRRRTRPPSFSAHTWRIFSVSSVESATLAEEHSLGRARSWERRLVGKLACGGA